MIKYIKNLFKKKTATDNGNIILVPKPPTNALSFTIMLVFDVGVNDKTMEIHVPTVSFVSNDELSTKFITKNPEDIVRYTMATLCQAASAHIADPSNTNFSKFTSQPPPVVPPLKTDTSIN